MSKKLIRHKTARFKTGKWRKKLNFSGASWISIILAVLAGSVVLGGLTYIPDSKRTPISAQALTIPDPDCTGDNLHLCTFIIASLTPTPVLENAESENRNRNRNRNRDNNKDKGTRPTVKRDKPGGGGGNGPL